MHAACTLFAVRMCVRDGPCSNLAEHAEAKVDIHLHSLPVIRDMLRVDAEGAKGGFKLALGRSAETSGGLLVALPSAEAAAAFCADIAAADGQPAWIIGTVVEGSGKAFIEEDVTFIEV